MANDIQSLIAHIAGLPGDCAASFHLNDRDFATHLEHWRLEVLHKSRRPAIRIHFEEADGWSSDLRALAASRAVVRVTFSWDSGEQLRASGQLVGVRPSYTLLVASYECLVE
jgi:hypothetical protein